MITNDIKSEYTLIIPMINVSLKYQNSVPIEFRYDIETGEMNCIKALKGIDTSKFTKIIFVILKKHNDKYYIVDKIESAMFRFQNEYRNIPYITFIIDEPTTSQVETVYKTIIEYSLTDNIFIKDADNMCYVDNIILGNSILAYNLENLEIVDPQHKSYVTIDDQNFITNIIEKRVISPIFNCGGYSFANVNDFIEAYNALKNYQSNNNHLYISHLIYWLILNKNLKFRPIYAIEYNDFDIN